MSTVDITIRTVDENTVQTAKKIQSEMDTFSNKLKEAGVSQKAYTQALKENEKQTKSASEANQKQKMSLTEVNSTIQLVKQGLEAMKKGYEFARQGAEIDFLGNKFDNLTANIGTTSEALLRDLRDATRGTLSDLELMASATDMVGLGLAKDHDEAVRLATVSAGLGMNMNQLVLTLTNMTTMRFDALGVRVDGFKERVDELKKSGLSADAAFKEAFLQQAEQQLRVVGNAADSTLGSFKQFEAELKNVGDESKMMAAQLAGPVVSALAQTMEESRVYREVLSKVNKDLYDQYVAQGRITPEMRDVVQEYQRAEQYGRAWGDVLKDTTPDIITATKSAEDLAKELKAMTDENKNYLNTITSVAGASKTYRDGIAEADAQLKAHQITTKEHAAEIKKLAKEYESAASDIVLSLLEMKYTADGTFDDKELNKYLDAMVRFGKITVDDKKATVALYTEVDDLDRSLSPVIDKFNNYVNKVDQAADGAEGFAQAQSIVGSALRSDLLPVLSNTVSQFDQLPASGTAWRYYFSIETSGSVPNLSGVGTGGGGGGVGQNTAEARAAGGYTSSRYVVVGDSLGGGWTPYTEVVDMQTGYVYNARDALKLKEGGYLSGAAHMAQGSDPYESSGGGGPTKAPPFKPPTTTRTSGSRANSHGGGAADVNITVGGGADIAAEVASIAPEVSQSVAAQVSAVIAEQQAKTNKLVQQAITNKLDELIGVMLNANPRAIGTEVGYQVAKLS